MSFTKHLWEFKDNYYMGEVPLNHKAKNPYFDSWKEFLECEESILSCNCSYSAPLIYWNWVSNVNCENKDLLVLIFPCWFSGVSSIKILVTRSDEDDIRAFMKKYMTLCHSDQ